MPLHCRAWLAAAACALLLPAAVSAGFAPTCDPAAVQPALPGVHFERCALLRGRSIADGTPALRMLWRVNGDGTATIGLHIDTALDSLGYVGVGAGWNGGMKGAELWVAQLVDGEFSLRALWSEDYTRPEPSATAQAQLSLRGWTSTSRGSIWAFTRPLASAAAERVMSLGDPMGDIMLWSVGSEPGEFGYHGTALRGTTRILLSSSSTVPDVAAPSDAKVVRIVTPPVTTDDKTVSRYCWSWHKLPADRKFHITRVAPMLAHPELRSLVHHMVTYACPESFEQGGGGADGDTLRAGGVVCRAGGGMPPACPQNFIGWADAGTITYPSEAGFPFGAGETRSILLEVHYENLALTPGIVDTSGLLFTYTSQLRKHDLGYIIVGDALERQAPQVQRAPQTLPSGHAEYEVANLCPASCTRRMATEDMHVVSTTFHMHVKGVHEYLELWRDGKRHGRISQQYWDFLRQDALPNDALIHPGDELLTRCVYNTRNATSPLPPYVTGAEPAGGSRDVVGGFGTYNDQLKQFEEMCYAFVLVWPRPRRSTCIDLRNTGWPGVVYCEASALNRLLPQNVLMQPSDPRTGKHDQFVLDRVDREWPVKSALPLPPPLSSSF